MGRSPMLENFGQYWRCECNKGWSGNGIQCMDSDGAMSALPNQHVEVTLTMTAGLYDDAPVQDQFNHGSAWRTFCPRWRPLAPLAPGMIATPPMRSQRPKSRRRRRRWRRREWDGVWLT